MIHAISKVSKTYLEGITEIEISEKHLSWEKHRILTKLPRKNGHLLVEIRPENLSYVRKAQIYLASNLDFFTDTLQQIIFPIKYKFHLSRSILLQMHRNNRSHFIANGVTRSDFGQISTLLNRFLSKWTSIYFATPYVIGTVPKLYKLHCRHTCR